MCYLITRCVNTVSVSGRSTILLVGGCAEDWNRGWRVRVTRHVFGKNPGRKICSRGCVISSPGVLTRHRPAVGIPSSLQAVVLGIGIAVGVFASQGMVCRKNCSRGCVILSPGVLTRHRPAVGRPSSLQAVVLGIGIAAGVLVPQEICHVTPQVRMGPQRRSAGTSIAEACIVGWVDCRGSRPPLTVSSRPSSLASSSSAIWCSSRASDWASSRLEGRRSTCSRLLNDQARYVQHGRLRTESSLT